MSELTCEQRRAIEYGIDQPPEEDAPMEPTPCSVSAHMRVEPGRSQVRKLLPGEPNPRDYQDPIAYAAMYRAWLNDQEPEEEKPRPRTHTIDYDVLRWTTP
jgi:hypothetical protein